MRRMQATELAQYIKDAKPLLIDVREPWEYEICHLEQSLNIPMGQIAEHLGRVREAEECVLICHHGVRSMHVIGYLQQQGLDHLINLDGGIDAWARDVDTSLALY